MSESRSTVHKPPRPAPRNQPIQPRPAPPIQARPTPQNQPSSAEPAEPCTPADPVNPPEPAEARHRGGRHRRRPRLAASIALARSLRIVIVIDAGSPRNAPSAHAHNILGQEGINPIDLLAKGRREAEEHGVQFIDASVLGALTDGQASETLGFVLEASVGVSIEAKRIVIATGLTDELPDIPGLAEGWGDTVLHSPYRHGYEVRGQNIGTTAMSYHRAMMFSQLSDHVTFLRHNAPGPDESQTTMLESLGIAYVDATVEAVVRTDVGTNVRLRNDSGPSDMANTASGVMVGAQINAELIMSSVS